MGDVAHAALHDGADLALALAGLGGDAAHVRDVGHALDHQHVAFLREVVRFELRHPVDVLACALDRVDALEDVTHGQRRTLDYPVWASDITPVTGKWRIETVEINGPVQIGEVRVAAGDLVVADDTGVCFIPRDVVLEVLDAAEQKAKAEAVRCKAIDDGVPVPDIARATYGEK